MFDNTPIPSDRNNGDLSLNQVRDGVASLTHRVEQIEALLSRKMDRSQCLSICQKKVSHSQLRRSLDQLESRFRDEQEQELERNKKMQQIAIQKIGELGKKLKKPTHKKKEDLKSNQKQQNKKLIQPQQLFIESNQTMFSLLIEQISKLQNKDDDLHRELDIRNRKMINLNNEVCNKLEKMEKQLDEKLKFNQSISDSKYVGNTWSHIDKSNKVTVHKSPSNNNPNDTSQFENFRMDMLSKNIENLQQQLLNKMNIKDVLPLLKQNFQPLSDSLDEVKEYVEQSISSTKKILSSQTEINKEISLGVRLGWWHSYQQEHQFAIINKEILNLVPQLMEVGGGAKPNYVQVHQQGLYLIKIMPVEANSPFVENEEDDDDDDFQIMIGTEVHLVGRQNAIRLQKNSQIRIIERGEKELVFSIHKL